MRDYKELNEMLSQATDLMEQWKDHASNVDVSDKKEFAEAIRNYNALKGVVKTLKWTMQYPDIECPLW